MNYDFVQRLDNAKTMDNASAIEAIKKLYLACEKCDEPSSCYFADPECNEWNGHKLRDDCYEFECGNGTVRLTHVDNNTVLVEASPTGTDEMYHTVGKVGIDTNLSDALKLGKEALGNDALVESWFGDMAKNVGKKIGKAAAVGAMAVAPALTTACAGGNAHFNTMPDDGQKEYVAEEYGIDTTKQVDGNKVIPVLVEKIAQKIAMQTGQNADNDYSVANVPAAGEAKKIYDMLKSGEIQVVNQTLDPSKHTQQMAQKDAADSFKRGLNKMFHQKLSINGNEFIEEMN